MAALAAWVYSYVIVHAENLQCFNFKTELHIYAEHTVDNIDNILCPCAFPKEDCSVLEIIQMIR